jgi:hypothetical protein
MMESETLIATVALAIAFLAPGLTWWLNFTPKGSLLREAQLVSNLPMDSAARPIMLDKLDTRLLLRQWWSEKATRNLGRGIPLVVIWVGGISLFFYLDRYNSGWVLALRLLLVPIYSFAGSYGITDLMLFRRDARGNVLYRDANTPAWLEWREQYYRTRMQGTEPPPLRGAGQDSAQDHIRE